MTTKNNEIVKQIDGTEKDINTTNMKNKANKNCTQCFGRGTRKVNGEIIPCSCTWKKEKSGYMPGRANQFRYFVRNV